ncbi:MAG: trypsin-like serine protease [Proteobacteria bacterium]|nr:trypsin-like serine protease [Pseudomonadota bacterium]
MSPLSIVLFSLCALSARAQDFRIPASVAERAASVRDRAARRDKVENGDEVGPDDPIARTMAMLTVGRDGYCSATFLSPRTLLTAAHCLYGENPANMRVQVSVDSLFEVVPVRSINPHPSYRSTGEPSHLYDIGIIQLGRDFPLKARPARLASPEELEGRGTSDMTVAGYGRGFAGGRGGARVLRVGRIVGAVMGDQRRVVERVDPRRGQNACKGDSGGALLVGGPDSTALLGVHSRGARNANCVGAPAEKRFGISVLVWPFKDWIEEQIQ